MAQYEGILDRIESLMTGILESGMGSVSDKDMGLLEAASTKDDVMTPQEIGKYPDVGWTNMNDSPEVQQFLDKMNHPNRVQVESIRQRVTDEQFQQLLQQLMAGQVPEGALHDSLPFQQYNTGGNLQNLGFTGAY